MGTSIGVVALGIANLDNQWNSLKKSQVAADRTQLMLDKATQKVARTQEALNKLVREGKTGTTEYELKLNDLTLAQDAVVIATERQEVAQTNLSEATENFTVGIIPNMIAIGGSMATMTQSLGLKFDKLSQLLGPLKSAFSGVRGEMLLMGSAATFGIAGGLLLVNQIQTMSENIKKAGFNFTEAKSFFEEPRIFANEQDIRSMEEYDEIIRRTGASLIELNTHPTEVMKKFKEMGGTFDDNGRIIITLKERIFDLGAGMSANSVQYIHWATNMLKSGDDVNTVLKFLTDSGIDAANAQKILAFAMRDNSQVVTMSRGILEDYNSALHNTTEESSAAVKYAKLYTGGIQSEFDALYKEAVQLGVSHKALEEFDDARNQSALTVSEYIEKLERLIYLRKQEIAASTDTSDVLKTENSLLMELGAAAGIADISLALLTAQAGMTDDEIAALNVTAQTHIDILDEMGSILTILPNKEKDWSEKQAESNKIIAEQEAEAKRLATAHEKLIRGIDDLANKYQINLSPSLIATEKNLQALSTALEDVAEAKAGLADLSDILGNEAFKIKFDIDEKYEKFIDRLGGDLETNVKLTFKAMNADAEVQKLLAMIAKTELNLPITLQTDEDDADKFIEKAIKTIKEAYKRKGKDLTPDPNVQKIIDKLLEIEEAPDSWQKLTEYFGSNEFLSLIKLIDPRSAEIIDALLPEGSITTALQSNINKQLSKFGVDETWLNSLPDNSKGFAMAILGLGGEGGEDGTSIVIKPTVDKTAADTTIAEIKTSITNLGQILPQINLQKQTADASILEVSRGITDLTVIQPQISLKNKDATKVLSATAKGIMNLEDLKPQIQLKNRDAFEVIAATAKEIMDLEDLTPTIHVQVEYDGIQSFQHGGHFITDGPQVIKVGDNPSGKEEVTINPIPHGSRGGPGFGTRNGRGPGGMSAAGYGPGVMEFHVTNVLMDREITRVYRRSMGENQARFV
jgi:hypothetical protein